MIKEEKKKRQPVNYIDNKKLLQVMVEYKTAVEQAKKDGKPKPRVPEYVGECLLKIGNRLSTMRQFASYSFKEEMISDAILNCLTYIDNFDPEKTQNPFSYFTQTMFYAFIRRIQYEKHQKYIKLKYTDQYMIERYLANELLSDEPLTFSDDSVTSPFAGSATKQADNNIDFIRDYESKRDEKKKKTKMKKKEKENGSPNTKTKGP